MSRFQLKHNRLSWRVQCNFHFDASVFLLLIPVQHFSYSFGVFLEGRLNVHILSSFCPTPCLRCTFPSVFSLVALIGPQGMSHSQRINVKKSSQEKHVHSSWEVGFSLAVSAKAVLVFMVDAICT